MDLRNRTAFAAGHLSGSIGFELSDSFVTYLGWLYAWGAPLTLIGEDSAQIAAANENSCESASTIFGVRQAVLSTNLPVHHPCGRTGLPTSPRWQPKSIAIP